DSSDQQRTSPDSPATSPYPQQCASDPFQKANVWGVTRGWAVDPFEFADNAYQLALGTYHATVTILRPYRRLLHISAGNATATVPIRVVKSTGCCGPARRGRAPVGPLPSLPNNVPSLASPPRDALPDLVPLPSWGIATTHLAHKDFLDFAAAVWVGG